MGCVGGGGGGGGGGKGDRTIPHTNMRTIDRKWSLTIY